MILAEIKLDQLLAKITITMLRVGQYGQNAFLRLLSTVTANKLTITLR